MGGLETIVSILGHEFVRQGHEVRLVCKTKATDAKVFPFEVLRGSSHIQLLMLARWSDICFQANVSLKGLLPLLISGKPLAVSHNGWYSRTDGRIGWQDRLKQRVLRFSHNIAVSNAVADHLSSESIVVPNAYCADSFYLMPEVPRNKQLVFLGRLVSEKGADLLLDALAKLKQQGLNPQLTIIGHGPEEPELRRQAKDLNIDDQVEFAGLRTGSELARMLNEHLIMVIPTRCKEGFGIVALEGIACGCVPVGSDAGGLKEAIGPCGVTFPNGNKEELTRVLRNLLPSPEKLESFQAKARTHLARHRKEEVAKAYLEVFRRAVQ